MNGEDFYRGRKVLVTGGLGFLGSSLALRLVERGARVILVDNFYPRHGANRFNIRAIEGKVEVVRCDVRDRDAMRGLVAESEVVFHLAGQVSHVLSLKNPFPDIELNIMGTAALLELVREAGADPVFVYTGTRGQYGTPVRLPASEDDPSNPKGLHELTNLTAEKMTQFYCWSHGLRTVPLRLANVYGPRAQMRHPHYGVVNWFVRLALMGETIPVFGDGKILRDFVYVDDCVEALLRAGRLDAGFGEVINVGSDRPSCFLDVAEALGELVPGCAYELKPFSPERAMQEPGDFYSDITRARRRLDWEPTTPLKEGLSKTVEYYRGCLSEYLSPVDIEGGVEAETPSPALRVPAGPVGRGH